MARILCTSCHCHAVMSVRVSLADVQRHFSCYSQVTGCIKSQSQVTFPTFNICKWTQQVIKVIKSRVLNLQVESHGIYFLSSQVLSHPNSDLSWLWVRMSHHLLFTYSISYSPFMLLKTGVFTFTTSLHAWSFGKVVFCAFCFGEIKYGHIARIVTFSLC